MLGRSSQPGCSLTDVTDKTTRDRIAEAADGLFYRQGYGQTSFSHIADAVGISRGNFYHHFKSKDEILDAVIALRLHYTAGMLDQWAQAGGRPLERLRSFVGMLVANREDIRQHGCPVGSLCAELARLEHPSREEANRLFGLFRDWLRVQFADLGRGEDADALAMHMLARSQGIAALAQAFGDAGFIEREAQHLSDWLDEVAATTPRPRRR